MANEKVIKPTPCGYPTEAMGEKCRACRQYACHVYQDAPAPDYTPKVRKT